MRIQIRDIKEWQIFILSLIILLLLTISSATASIFIPVEDETYYLLCRLEAVGVIESGILMTRPMSHKEMVRLIREAEKNSKNKSPFIQSLVESLKEKFKDEMEDLKFIKPLESPYFEYGYSDSKDLTLNYNNNGYIFDKGSNIRAGLVSKAEFGWLSFYFNPEVRYSENETVLKLKRGYGVIQVLGLDLLIGKDSQWWGPGYHGGLLLTNNAEPMTMIKLTNSQPLLLPWILRYIGPLKFITFVTRLEKNREGIPEPYLWGMRLNFKPLPYFEFGASRTILLGGKGRSEDLRTWWKAFIGKTEDESTSMSGDQKAGYDLKLTLPFKFQPVQVYLEAAGEDNADTSIIPTHWAYVTGLYLPGILGFERIDLKVEYGSTKNKWYRHYLYGHYQYKGMIIGHHMGRDSTDTFAEISYLFPERNGKLSIFYDREKHRLYSDEMGRKDEIGFKSTFRLIDNIDIKLSYGYARVKENISGDEKKINNLTGMITYRF
jgi:hypothetical protein